MPGRRSPPPTADVALALAPVTTRVNAEGMEQTLMVTRLGVTGALKRTLCSTKPDRVDARQRPPHAAQRQALARLRHACAGPPPGSPKPSAASAASGPPRPAPSSPRRSAANSTRPRPRRRRPHHRRLRPFTSGPPPMIYSGRDNPGRPASCCICCVSAHGWAAAPVDCCARCCVAVPRGRWPPPTSQGLGARQGSAGRAGPDAPRLLGQTLVPDILLQQSRAHSLRVGDVANAARLEHRIRRDLLQAEGFEAAATRDPALRNHNSVDARALRAAAAGWDDWVSALLGRATSQRHGRARHIAELEAKAVRLHQAAYAAVDASLKAALETR